MMKATLTRIGLILLITHTCSIASMDPEIEIRTWCDHDWWQNGKDADPTPPTQEQKAAYQDGFIRMRVILLAPDIQKKVSAALADARENSAFFSAGDAEKIIERYEEEDEREEQKIEDRRFWFFHSKISDQNDE